MNGDEWPYFDATPIIHGNGSAVVAAAQAAAKAMPGNSTAQLLSMSIGYFVELASFMEESGPNVACTLWQPFNYTDPDSFWPRAMERVQRNLYAKRIIGGMCFPFVAAGVKCFCNSSATPQELCPQLEVLSCPKRWFDFSLTETPSTMPESLSGKIAAILYCITIPLALSASLIAIIVWAKHRHLKTVTNIFIMNLMFSNVAFVIFRVSGKAFFSINSLATPWIIREPIWLADVSCRIFHWCNELCLVLTVYTLAIIGYERYQAICNPLESQRQLSRKRAYKLLAALWLVAIVISSPALALNGAVAAPVIYGYLPKCDRIYYGADANILVTLKMIKVNVAYLISITVTQFIIPAIILVVVYGKILKTLIERGRTVELLGDDKDATVLKNKDSKITSSHRSVSAPSTDRKTRLRDLTLKRSRRATIMCCCCLLAFVLLWAPSQFANLLNAVRYVNPSPAILALVPTLHPDMLNLYEAIACTFLFFNPIIYCATNRQWWILAKRLLILRSSSSVGSENEMRSRDNGSEKLKNSSSSGNKSYFKKQFSIRSTDINLPPTQSQLDDAPSSVEQSSGEAIIYRRRAM